MANPQVIFGQCLSMAANNATHFMGFGSNHIYTGGGFEFQAYVPWACAGTFRNLKIALLVAPGSGKSWTFNVRNNGAATGVSVTIANLATEGEDTSNSFAVFPGDVLTLQSVPSGSPTSPGSEGLKYTVEFEPTNPGESCYAIQVGTVSNAAARYNGLFHVCQGTDSTWPAASTETRSICPIDGTITGCQIKTSAAPGAGDTLDVYIVQNGVKQDGTGGTVDTLTQVSGTATTGSASFSLPVSSGDQLYLECTPTGSPAAVRLATAYAFDATIPGQFVIAGWTSDGFGTSTGSNVYAKPAGDGSWTATEANVAAKGPQTTISLSRLFIATDVGPGTTSVITVTLRKNGANTALSAALSGSEIEEEDTSNSVDVGDADTLNMHQVITVATAAASGWTAWAMAGATEVLTPLVDAGPDQHITIPTGAFTHDGTVTNAPSPSSTQWTLLSGPVSPADSGLTLSDDAVLDPTGVVTVPGTYVWKLTLFDETTSPATEYSDTMTLTVTQELNPCTGGGTVEIGTDPVNGTALANATGPIPLVVFHFDSGDVPVCALPLNNASDYYGGRAAPRLLDIGRPRLAVSDQFGGMQTATIHVILADHDRAFRTLMRAETLINRSFSVYIGDYETIKAEGTLQRFGHYAITNIEPIGDMTFRISGADFVGSEVSRFFAERQLTGRKFQRTVFPQLPLALIGKEEAGYYGWVGDDSLEELDTDAVELDPTAGYGGQLNVNIPEIGWGTTGVTGPSGITLGESAGGVYGSGDTAYVFVTAVVGGVETDPYPLNTGAGESFAFSGSGMQLDLSCPAVTSATAYRWYVRINGPWGHTADPRDAEVFRETATNSTALTDAGNENGGPWPPPDTDWSGIQFTGPAHFIVLARYPAGLTPRQAIAGFVKWGPWANRPSRIAWTTPGSPADPPNEYWVISVAGNTMINKWVVDGAENFLDLTIQTPPHEIINGNLTQQGAIPLHYVGEEIVDGVTRAAFFASIGVIRISAIHGSDLATPATRIKLDTSVYGSTLFVPGKTGWPFATLYRSFFDDDGDERWYTMVYGDTTSPIIQAAIDGTIPLTANACGFSQDARGEDDDGDASPTISSLAYQLLHFLDNFGNPQDGAVWKSGAWKSPHERNSVPVHRGTTFTTAKTYAESLVSGGFVGGWGFAVDGAAFSLDAWLRAAAINHDGRWTINEHGQLCLLMVNPSAASVATFTDGSVSSSTAANIPQHALVQIIPRTTDLINEIRYVYKKNYVASVTRPTPAEYELLPRTLAEQVDWYSGTIKETDDDSIADHLVRKSLDVEFSMHRDGAGPAVIVQRMLARWAYPLEAVKFPASLLAADVSNGQAVTWNHHAGAGASGAVGRELWITAKEIDANVRPDTPSSLDVWLEADDITDL